MTTRFRHGLWAVLGALCAIAAAAAAHAADVIATASGDQPVITLTREHGMVKGVEDRPLVRLYADGHVAITVPPYMKGAGFYEFRLDRAEFDRLMRDFDANGLMRFDTEAVQARHAQAKATRQRATGVRFVTTDSTITRIDVNFAQFGRSGEQAASITRRIAWADLAVEAERYPQLDELAGLASVEQQLLALVDDSRRRPVKAPTRQ